MMVRGKVKTSFSGLKKAVKKTRVTRAVVGSSEIPPRTATGAN